MSFLKEWNDKGTQFAKEINEMFAFAAAHGWDKWEKKEITDDREHLAGPILEALREANKTNTVAAFRESYAPSLSPFINLLSDKGQFISDIHVINDHSVVFLTGASYEKRQAYLWDGKELQTLDASIVSIGKSPQGNCFAVAGSNNIVTTFGWGGTTLYEFEYPPVPDLAITQLIPYNDGAQVLVVSSQGIYRLSEQQGLLIHPGPDEEDYEEDDEDWGSDIDMEHAALSPDNSLICVGDQDSSHIVLNAQLELVADITPHSEYPHFALFSKDGKQLIMNACHFYNGTTIAAPTDKLTDEDVITIDQEDRVYSGVAATDYYIWGNAYGYVKAFDFTGKLLWQHYLGSSITGLALSDDESTLYVGGSSGIFHQLKLGAGHRDDHTIGNANHYEECRWIFWKDEAAPLKW